MSMNSLMELKQLIERADEAIKNLEILKEKTLEEMLPLNELVGRKTFAYALSSGWSKYLIVCVYSEKGIAMAKMQLIGDANIELNREISKITYG